MKNVFSHYILLIPLLFLSNCSLHKAPALNSSRANLNDQNAHGASADSAAATEDNKTDARGDVSSVIGNGSGTPHARRENGDGEQNLLDNALELTEEARGLWAEGDPEGALETLDEAYALILKVEPENSEKLSQQKEDLRFMISKRILEIYASRMTAANGTHNEIPLTVNSYVEREIQLFQTLERDFFMESYRRSGRYRADMVKAFKASGLPEDLSWLPLIESGFKVKALSRSRALGLWQFIPSTGYKFGLARNDWIDERLDPAKATAAAIAYLKELHQIFGDWATVLAAYNCGEGSVLRVIRDQKTNYLDNFWDLFERLPYETARYYPKFLAVLAIIKDPAKYGFALEEPEKPVSYETATIEKPVHLKTLADKIGGTFEDLASLNPELRREATPSAPYTLKVPSGMGQTVMANLDSVPKYTPPKMEFVYHRVRRGETLSLIAMRYRTSIQKIVETNRLRGASFIRVGQKLKIPLRGTS